MRISAEQVIKLRGQRIRYRVIPSRFGRHLRVRVGPRGVEVMRPTERTSSDVRLFLVKSAPWVLDQLRRVEGLRGARRVEKRAASEVLFRGVPTPIRVEGAQTRSRCNTVAIGDQGIVVRRGGSSSTPPSRSLETWLRKQARAAIEGHLVTVTARLRQPPARVYVMNQRTKWGNCSARRNLSFNWRLILAPDFVLRYMVTHEAVHLAVPDHSAKFWLTVQSLCPEAERARQWLAANQRKLTIDLGRVVRE
jgi:predicted metal-dependent hydrolase